MEDPEEKWERYERERLQIQPETLEHLDMLANAKIKWGRWMRRCACCWKRGPSCEQRKTRLFSLGEHSRLMACLMRLEDPTYGSDVSYPDGLYHYQSS
jgi:hypothetical protein